MDRIMTMLNSLDKNIKKIMKYGLLFCFMLAIISCIVLVIYKLFYDSPTLYKLGIYIFRNSILFSSMFFACGIAFDKIKKELF